MTTANPPVIVGRYRLIRPLGQGGMGTVWEGHDTVLDRPIAVKEVILPIGVGDEQRAELIERATREARTAARLNHRGIIAIYDAVQHDGRPWIVMELVPSRSLDDIVTEDGPLPAVRVAEIGREVLSALTCAHAAGVIHRDVKPANILVGRDGRIVLTDFGIATFEEDTSLTRTGMVTGSPSFIAPERVTGAQAGPASDLWSLGATLYALLTGRSPFHRDSGMAVLAALISNEQADLGQVPPEIRPALAGLLVKDPAYRVGAGEADRMLAAVAGPMPGGPTPGPGPGGAMPGGFGPYGGVPGDRVSGPSVPGLPMPGGPVRGGMPGDRVSGPSAPGLPVPGGAMPGGHAARGVLPGDRLSGRSMPGLAVPGGPGPGGFAPNGGVPGDRVSGPSVPGLPMPGGPPGRTPPGGSMPGAGRDGAWPAGAHPQHTSHPMARPTQPVSQARTSGWGLGHWALLAAAVAVVLAVVTTVAWNLLDSATADGTVGNGNSSASTSARPLPLQPFSSDKGWSVRVPKSWKNDHSDYGVQWWSDPKGRAVLTIQVDDSDADPMAYLRKEEQNVKADSGSKYRRIEMRKISLPAGQAAELDFTAFTPSSSLDGLELKGGYREIVRVISTGSSFCYLSWQVRVKDWDALEPTMRAVFKSFTAPA
ncbi:serine/threonine-protein kinase [Microtetraspora fusca]|uniref:serine/threonine-protein kinase n=1 Tax=Microtetraspora fusca TaxID=1997 RepID=UPI001C3F3177|nr:serine/threonine-protein kinase [Microtetraspora fusca]